MIVDSSALVAIILEEPGHDELIDAVEEADTVGVGAPTLVEASVVLAARTGPVGITLLRRVVDDGEFAVVPFTRAHHSAAVDAFLRYGKGYHPARLNLGDCFSYATASLAGHPLLCTGSDFLQTDLQLAVPPVG